MNIPEYVPLTKEEKKWVKSHYLNRVQRISKDAMTVDWNGHQQKHHWAGWTVLVKNECPGHPGIFLVEELKKPVGNIVKRSHYVYRKDLK